MTMEMKIKALILTPIAIAASALATDKTVSPGAMYFEKYMMFVSYALCGALLLLTIFAGQMHQEVLFVCAAILAIFFWASLFSLFPITVGHYFGETAAGSNYGLLYAIAKGSGDQDWQSRAMKH